jgi:hydrogenase maturation protein HypF
VAPGNRDLGLMLPYTPLHHLLCAEVGAPIVLTSGNVSDEPIAYDDDDARTRLSHIADAFLQHDRRIHVRVDDSVARVFRGVPLALRRSRGYAPRPVSLPVVAARPTLGCGAELKSTFCLATGSRAFVSHHIGDLENAETFASYVEGIEHYARLFGVEPVVVAHDLHPEYLSTKYALGLEGVELVAVQHHHAHIAACLADNGESGPVIGVAFDGLGYGADDTLWGGEFLVADLQGYRRAGTFATVPMPGGTAAIREPWRMAAAYLNLAYAGDIPTDLPVVARHAELFEAIVRLGRGDRAPRTSSVGRLFDAVAALVGVRDQVSYEGQAAIELEQRSGAPAPGRAVSIRAGSPFQVDGIALLRTVADDVRAGLDTSAIGARFHGGLVTAIVQGCALIRDEHGLSRVALSGGVFQNVLLLRGVHGALAQRGFEVLTHRQLPPNDGGISVGQVAVAAAQDS